MTIDEVEALDEKELVNKLETTANGFSKASKDIESIAHTAWIDSIPINVISEIVVGDEAEVDIDNHENDKEVVSAAMNFLKTNRAADKAVKKAINKYKQAVLATNKLKTVLKLPD